MCSGPTFLPASQRKDSSGIQDGHEDESQSDSGHLPAEGALIPKTHLSPDDQIAVSQKVTDWLSDDAFVPAGSNRTTGISINNVDDPQESTLESEELSQQSGCDFSSAMEERGSFLRCNKGASLLEVKERFVRKVQSILVEGNNETDSVSSSADETGLSTPVTLGPDLQRNSLCPAQDTNHTHQPDRTEHLENNASRRLFKQNHIPNPGMGASCATVNQDPPSGGLETDDSTILAGHFDEGSPPKTTKCKVVLQDYIGKEEREKCMELIQSPSGKMEWTAHGKAGPNEMHQRLRKQRFLENSDNYLESTRLTSVTPKKSHVPEDTTEGNHDRVFKTPLAARTPKSKETKNTRIVQTHDQEPSQDILSNIVDFFKSPLPQLLNSPMPLLSPRVNPRTVQGKKITRNSSNVQDTHPTKKLPFSLPQSTKASEELKHIALSGSSKGKQSQITKEIHQAMAHCAADSDLPSETVDAQDVQEGMNGSAGRHTSMRTSLLSSGTEESEIEVNLLHYSSSDAPVIPIVRSPDQANGIKKSPRTPTKNTVNKEA